MRENSWRNYEDDNYPYARCSVCGGQLIGGECPLNCEAEDWDDEDSFLNEFEPGEGDDSELWKDRDE